MTMRPFHYFLLMAALLVGAAGSGCSDDEGDGGTGDLGGDADVGGDGDQGTPDTSNDPDATPDAEPDAEPDLTADADAGDDPVPDTGDDLADGGDAGDVADEDVFVEPIIWDDDDHDPNLGHWSDSYAIAGATGEIGARVNALAEDSDGNIYIGGEFLTVGGAQAENVAMWDGAEWHALLDEFGTGAGLIVNAIAIDANDNVFVGGEAAGGGIGLGFGIGGSNAVKRWDGVAWTNVGPDLDGTVHALAFVDGDLWVGGNFNRVDPDPFSEEDPLGPRGLAIWDGEAYVPATEGGEGTFFLDDEFDPAAAPVHAIALNGDGDPCIGGDFAEIDGVTAPYVACLAEGAWSDWSAGINSIVNVLHGDETRFFAGGYFDGAVSEWDGDSWETYEGGVAGGLTTYVNSLALDGDDLYVGGQFLGAGSGGSATSVQNVTVYREGSWRQLDGGVAFTVGGVSIAFGVNALLATADYVYAGGQFTQAGEIGAINLARWSFADQSFEVVFDLSKQAFGTGGPVNAFAQDEDGTLYVAGNFAFIGSDAANNVAARDASGSWYALGEGIGEGGFGDVRALAVAADGTLYAGGGFTEIGILSADYFTWWNGASWRAATQQLDGPVLDLAACPNGDIVAAGQFRRYGDESTGGDVAGLAIFDGVDWRTLPLAEGEGYGGQAVACGEDDAIYTEVGITTIVEDEEGEEEEVTTWHVYRWDPVEESWSPLGDAFGDPETFRQGPFVYDFDVYGGVLYAGGNFRLIGEAEVLAIASWDGEAWASVGDGLWTGLSFSPGSVYGIDAKQNGLFAIGYFNGSGVNEEDDSIVTRCDFVCWHDDEGWHGLGPTAPSTFGDYIGLNDLGEALIIHGASLFVGGPFSQAGGEPALGLGEYVYEPQTGE